MLKHALLFFQLSLQDVVPVLDLPAPPDGGWGWIIVAASFFSNFVLDGIAYSFGVLLVPLVEHFDSTRRVSRDASDINCDLFSLFRSSVSWVGSLLCGVYLSSGPIVGGLVNKFGCRPVCIAGGIFSCVALLLSTLSKAKELFNPKASSYYHFLILFRMLAC